MLAQIVSEVGEVERQSGMHIINYLLDTINFFGTNSFTMLSRQFVETKTYLRRLIYSFSVANGFEDIGAHDVDMGPQKSKKRVKAYIIY